MDKSIAIISLGCAKNLVNSEQMLYLLSEAGYALSPDPDGADAVIINTCGFIDAAKSEAIDTILEMARLKVEGRLGKILVTGCLSERYRAEVTKELPEVDAILGVGSFGEIVPAVDAVFRNEPVSLFSDNSAPVDEIPRIVSTGPAWAYLRIAEGCDNYCAFCAIPYIRGRYRSREFEKVTAEAEALARCGAKEIIIIAQDITRYGTDLYGRRRLAELCRAISRIDGIEWIRLHYTYPDQFDDELIDEVASNPKIVKYLDIPIQHINNKILKSMNRRGSGDDIRALFKTLRERIPGLVIRTSLIVGLPGEGEAEFEELCEFLREVRLERAGVFPFSPEEGTPAAKMPHCSAEEAQRRAERIMDIQAQVMDEFSASLVGKTLPVICTGAREDFLVGRSCYDSPDIDNLVYFDGSCAKGDIVSVKISSVSEDGNLIGQEVKQ